MQSIVNPAGTEAVPCFFDKKAVKATHVDFPAHLSDLTLHSSLTLFQSLLGATIKHIKPIGCIVSPSAA